MKKRNHALIILTIFTSLIASCTFELLEDVPPELDTGTTKPGSVLNGISDETFNAIPVDEGEIGVSIDTRTLAIYGYKPSKLSFAIDGSLSTYSQGDIPVNEFTHVATFKLKRIDLTDDELKGFSNGIPIIVTVYDVDGNTLASRTITRYLINTTARTLRIDPDLPRILKPLSFNPDMLHYVQIASETEYKTLGFGIDFQGFTEKKLGIIEGYRKLYFIQSPNYEQDSSYNIKSYVDTYEFQGDAYLEADLDGNNGENIAINWYIDDDPNNPWTGENRFVLEQTQVGTVKIRIYDSNTYLSSSDGTHVYFDTNTTNDLEFNIFTDNITWKFDDLGTKYSPAIIPPTQMDFAFQQTIS